MARLKVYLDSSVIGGLIDEEPPGRKAATAAFFDLVAEGTGFEPYISELVVDEIADGPAKLAPVFDALVGRLEFRLLEVSDEAEELADRYLLAGVIPKSERDDALHLALAALAEVDTVVSWNFRHMVNLRRIRGVNGVNLIHGYRQIDVRSPEEVGDVGD